MCVKPWVLYYTMACDMKHGMKKTPWNLTILSSNHRNIHSKMCMHILISFLKY